MSVIGAVLRELWGCKVAVAVVAVGGRRDVPGGR
jgi:hypothetical protein